MGRSFDSAFGLAQDDTTCCHGFESIPTRSARATIPGLPRNEEPPYPVILSGAAIGGAVEESFPSDVGRSFDSAFGLAQDDTTCCHGFESIPTRSARATIPGLPRNEEPPYPVILSGAAIGGAVEESFPSDVGRSFGFARDDKAPRDTWGGLYKSVIRHLRHAGRHK